MAIESELTTAGLTVVFEDLVLPPILPGAGQELTSDLMTILQYHASGKFRSELAYKLTAAKLGLAEKGNTIGGDPPYGFERWLCAADGTPKERLERGKKSDFKATMSYGDRLT